MGKDLYASFPESKRVFEKADEVLGFSLSGLIFGGPGEALINTVTSQPAILAASIAAFEAFRQRSGVKPAYLAGLSLGEYSALIAAGSLSFEAGLRLVRKRAEIMEEAAHRHPGGMAAVLDLPIGQLRDICLKAGAEIANINAPGQVVVAGGVDDLEWVGSHAVKQSRDLKDGLINFYWTSTPTTCRRTPTSTAKSIPAGAIRRPSSCIPTSIRRCRRWRRRRRRGSPARPRRGRRSRRC